MAKPHDCRGEMFFVTSLIAQSFSNVELNTESFKATSLQIPSELVNQFPDRPKARFLLWAWPRILEWVRADIMHIGKYRRLVPSTSATQNTISRTKVNRPVMTTSAEDILVFLESNDDAWALYGWDRFQESGSDETGGWTRVRNSATFFDFLWDVLVWMI